VPVFSTLGGMKDNRRRQPLDADYANALGEAAFCFSLCEWQVVWCCEKIKPGSLSKITGDQMTAGQIAKHFTDVVRNMPRSGERAELQRLAESFMRLVATRNDILHGKPCTGPNGRARLSGSKVLEIEDLNNAADAFSGCSIELNSIFYGFLSSYQPHAA
jgi:hypothetical protein